MTDEKILQLWFETKHPIAFAHLVANTVRDEDAEICDALALPDRSDNRFAAAIRARNT